MTNPRTLRELERYGIPSWVIDGWITDFNHRTGQDLADYNLTEFQSQALGSAELFSSTQNILVNGPTSSGKTLIAQAALAHLLQRSRRTKVIYLVPLRALVTEKWIQLKAVFGDHYRILPLSSDYPETDRKIARGEWDIAVAVFEKIYRWIADPRRVQDLLKDVHLVIADELQVIDREERGEKLEIILSFLRWWQVLID